MGIIVPSHRAEHGIKVLHLPDDDMLDLSFALQGSPDSKTACTNQDAAVPFEHVGITTRKCILRTLGVNTCRTGHIEVHATSRDAGTRSGRNAPASGCSSTFQR